MLNDTMRTSESGWTILPRLIVGLVVFLPEGIQKLASPMCSAPGASLGSAFHFPKSWACSWASSRSFAGRGLTGRPEKFQARAFHETD